MTNLHMNKKFIKKKIASKQIRRIDFKLKKKYLTKFEYIKDLNLDIDLGPNIPWAMPSPIPPLQVCGYIVFHLIYLINIFFYISYI